MTRCNWVLGVLLIGASLLFVPVSAKQTKADLGLTQGPTICDGKQTYRYLATWKARPGSLSYQVATGNQCKFNGITCGISSKTCPVKCTADGGCSAQLTQCQIGHGSPWVRVGAIDYTVYQQIPAYAASELKRCPLSPG